MPDCTASLRNEALDAERLCRWRIAGILWKQAISHYPAGTGAMRAADIARMQARSESCLATARQEEARRLS
jgi:hypothetical protein